jgi:hypothetical protein
MSIKTKANLTADTATAINDNTTRDISPADIRGAFNDLIDSSINRVDDKPLLNLREYNTARSYEVGEGAIKLGVIYQCTTATTGTFNPAHWSAIVGPEVIALNALSDVTISSPVNGQVLTYQGGVWVNQNAAGGVSGSGTLNKLPKWSGAASLTDSLLTEAAGDPAIYIAGSFAPDTNNTYSLGGPFALSNKYWKTLWLYGETRASSDLTWHVGSGVAQMKLETNGRLSIGSSITASGKLHIKGGGSNATYSLWVENDTPTPWFQLRDDRRLIYKDGNETNGFVLTTDGSGVATWQAAGGGGLTVGTTSIASGTIGGVLFQGSGNVLQQDSTNFFWDDTNNRLGIGTAAPSAAVHVKGSGTGSGTYALKVTNNTPTDLFTIKDNGEAYLLGSVGINTTTPSTSLHIYKAGTNVADSLLTIEANGSTTSGAVLKLLNSGAGGTTSFELIAEGAGFNSSGGFGILRNGSAYVLNSNSAGDWVIGANSPESGKRLRIVADGTSTNFGLVVYNNAETQQNLSVRNDGRVRMQNLPTSATGLVSGDLWNNSGVVNIV